MLLACDIQPGYQESQERHWLGGEPAERKEGVSMSLRKGWLVQERVKKSPDPCPKYLHKCRIANNTERFHLGDKCLVRSDD